MQQGTDTWTVRWPADRVAKLKQLWPVMTASQIGRIMGLSREAICGKVHRLGLPLKKLDRLLLPKRGGQPRKGPMLMRRKPAQPCLPPVPEIVVVSDTAAPEFLNRTFNDLVAGECRYPHGDRAPFTFCGNVTDGSSFCAQHHKLTHHPLTPMRRDWVDWGAR